MNFILIYTDQQRADTIGYLGNDNISTPNLDKLCREGVAFTHGTTPSPVCMPARWCLHTGQWASTHKCYSNHHPGPMPSFSLPSLLREGGYFTGLVGKNHSFLTPDDLDWWSEDPRELQGEAQKQREDYLKKNPLLRTCFEAVPGGQNADPEHNKTNEALKFLREKPKDKPFFLWLSYLNPHTPYQVSEPWFSQYAEKTLPPPSQDSLTEKPWRQRFHRINTERILPYDKTQIERMRQVYYAMISSVDHEIGRVLDFLDDSGEREDTLILFTSDHGDYQGDHGLLTKSPALYDCLVRVPFIISGPDWPRGETCSHQFVSHVDIAPTFLRAAGLPIPSEMEGKDIKEPFINNSPIRECAYGEYGIPGQPYNDNKVKEEGLEEKRYTNPGDPRLPWEGNPLALAGPIRMVRTEKWKMIEEKGGTWELYDLVQDPREVNNLFYHRGYEEVKAQLQELFP